MIFFINSFECYTCDVGPSKVAVLALFAASSVACSISRVIVDVSEDGDLTPVRNGGAGNGGGSTLHVRCWFTGKLLLPAPILILAIYNAVSFEPFLSKFFSLILKIQFFFILIEDWKSRHFFHFKSHHTVLIYIVLNS